ncbi:DUF2474 family protein [Aquamicrobium soli]|uniref:DUF2474 family protein n=1 Tax=Aquamicrobium soli TaxID=1811518 RepID=A0ABV7KBF6_9HYPH
MKLDTTDAARGGVSKRLAWFAGIWAASVLALALVALAIRLILGQ